MSSSIKLILAGVFAAVLVYLLTANSILQRVSYDIYECSNRSQGTAKLWFKKIKVGERFEFTWNSERKFLAIDEVSDEKVMSEKSATAKIIKQEKKLVENLIKRTHFSSQEIEKLLNLFRATVVSFIQMTFLHESQK